MLSLQVTFNILSLLLCVTHPHPFLPPFPSQCTIYLLCWSTIGPNLVKSATSKTIPKSSHHLKKSQQQFKYYLWLLSSLNDIVIQLPIELLLEFSIVKYMQCVSAKNTAFDWSLTQYIYTAISPHKICLTQYSLRIPHSREQHPVYPPAYNHHSALQWHWWEPWTRAFVRSHYFSSQL